MADTHRVQLDAVKLGLLWRRLDGIVDQVAETFVRAAFSVVVRDNYDMAFSLFDAKGRQLTQSKRSIPSFMGTLPHTLRTVLDRFPPEKLAPGDTIITNDPWIGTGHLNDISMVHPLFVDGALVAFAASTGHTVDIGGAPSPSAKDRYEEGLTIPIAKIVEAGKESDVVIDFLSENLRQPDETLGDLRAQFAAYRDCHQKVAALLTDAGLSDLTTLADEIIERSRLSMESAIDALPDGTYEDRFDIDGVDEPLHVACQVIVRGDRLSIDFQGTSAQVPWPINSVLNYTQAYARYAVKCLLDPQAPNNYGTLLPITVDAPVGSLLNATPPAPVWGRHLSGHYVPAAVIGALSSVMPERVVAESGAPLWNVYFSGAHRGRRFVKMFFMNGGHGARANSDGPGCLSFPSNVSNQPIEAFEHQVPLMIEEKAFIPDSGGAGKFRGGNAQRLRFRARSNEPITMTIRHERVQFPPRGLLGGEPGRAGRDLVNGNVIPAKTRMLLNEGDEVVFETAGGGGLYPAAERAPDAIANDRVQGLVSGTADVGAADE
ncbi:MAG: hydantoinase B/oxoprolinase family protein [Pseudomonadota bacterium]